MRQLIFINAFVSLALLGCWNFEALMDRTSSRDGGPMYDLYFCPTARLPLAEDCINGKDDNDDCLVDCEDPQCSENLICLDKQNQFIGYGSRQAKNATCEGFQTPTAIKQFGTPSADCSSSCACNASCNSTLRWYNAPDDCMTPKNEVGNLSLTSGSTTNDCKAIATPGTAYFFKLESVSYNGSCAAISSAGTPPSPWSTEETLCYQKGPCQIMSCMKEAKASCIAFRGDFAVCPAAFPKKTNNWVQSATDARICQCSCAQTGSSCVLGAGGATFTDQTSCTGTQMTAALTQSNSCAQAGINGNAVAAKAIDFRVRPPCQASGTVTGTVTPNSQTAITTCCTQ